MTTTPQRYNGVNYKYLRPADLIQLLDEARAALEDAHAGLLRQYKPGLPSHIKAVLARMEQAT